MKVVSVIPCVRPIANCLCDARVEAPVGSLLCKAHPIKASEDHDWNKRKRYNSRCVCRSS